MRRNLHRLSVCVSPKNTSRRRGGEGGNRLVSLAWLPLVCSLCVARISTAGGPPRSKSMGHPDRRLPCAPCWTAHSRDCKATRRRSSVQATTGLCHQLPLANMEQTGLLFLGQAFVELLSQGRKNTPFKEHGFSRMESTSPARLVRVGRRVKQHAMV